MRYLAINLRATLTSSLMVAAMTSIVLLPGLRDGLFCLRPLTRSMTTQAVTFWMLESYQDCFRAPYGRRFLQSYVLYKSRLAMVVVSDCGQIAILWFEGFASCYKARKSSLIRLTQTFGLRLLIVCRIETAPLALHM